MPADDQYDVVHERNKESPIYGCWNRQPFREGYYAQDRDYRPNGSFTFTQVFIPFRNSTDCRYDMSHKDLKCKGCSWLKDR